MVTRAPSLTVVNRPAVTPLATPAPVSNMAIGLVAKSGGSGNALTLFHNDDELEDSGIANTTDAYKAIRQIYANVSRDEVILSRWDESASDQDTEIVNAVRRLGTSLNAHNVEPKLIIIPGLSFGAAASGNAIGGTPASPTFVPTTISTARAVAKDLFAQFIPDAPPGLSITEYIAWINSVASVDVGTMVAVPDVNTGWLSPCVAGAIAANEAVNGINSDPLNKPIHGFDSVNIPYTFAGGQGGSEVARLAAVGAITPVRHAGWIMWGGGLAVGANPPADTIIEYNVKRVDNFITEHIDNLAFSLFGVLMSRVFPLGLSIFNTFLEGLEGQGVIENGVATAPASLNTPAARARKEAHFQIEYTPVGSARHLFIYKTVQAA